MPSELKKPNISVALPKRHLKRRILNINKLPLQRFAGVLNHHRDAWDQNAVKRGR
jgi:hypothetical protein